MISKQTAIDTARTIANANNCVWRDNDVHVEQREEVPPSKNWFKRRFLESCAGFPACWIVRVGKPPLNTDWMHEDMRDPQGEGYGYLINIDSGAFMGIDVGYAVTFKKYSGLKDPTSI
jgi:hypothetical protein